MIVPLSLKTEPGVIGRHRLRPPVATTRVTKPKDWFAHGSRANSQQVAEGNSLVWRTRRRLWSTPQFIERPRDQTRSRRELGCALCRSDARQCAHSDRSGRSRDARRASAIFEQTACVLNLVEKTLRDPGRITPRGAAVRSPRSARRTETAWAGTAGNGRWSPRSAACCR